MSDSVEYTALEVYWPGAWTADLENVYFATYLAADDVKDSGY